MITLRSVITTGALLVTLSGMNAHAGIFTPGTQDLPSPPKNGYPQWYTDPGGTSLAPCLSYTDNGAGRMCVLLTEGTYNADNPLEFPGNFPPEHFYFIADSLIDSIGADYRAALEGAFATDPPEEGQQISFVRIRIRFVPPVDGNYRVTHPFGQRVFTNVVAADGRFVKVEDRGIGQAGGPFLPFNSPEVGDISNVQRFLTRAAGPITVGNETFIGDPNIFTTVTGATFLDGGTPFNAFRIEIDEDKDGTYEQSFESNQFQVAGKLIGLTVVPTAGTDFLPQQLETASTAKTFTVTNISSGALTLDLNSFTSTNPEFVATATTCAQLASNASCTFDMVFTPTANGARTADITVSAGGTVPPAILKLTGTGDSIAPTVDITAPVAASFTNDATPLIQYTFNDGTVAVLVDGNPVTTVSGESLAGLGDGQHTLRVEATDTAGNVGFAETAFTVDTIAPTAAISGTPTNPTKNTTAELTVGGDQVVSYQFKHNNGAVSSFFPISEKIVLNGQVQGTHTISIFGKDQAGNVQATPTVVSWVVDTTPPSLDLTTSNLLTKVNSLLIEGTVEAGIVPVVTAAVPAVAGEVTESNGTWSCTISNLQETGNAVSITATDAAGNISTLNRTITLDTIPPVYTITGKPADPTNTKTATLAVSGAEVNTYQYKVDNDQFSGDVAAGTPISRSGLADGTHTVTVIAKDLAGNLGAEVSVSWTVDTVAPNPLTIVPQHVSTSQNAMSFSGTVEAGLTPVITANQPGATVGAVQVNGTEWTVSVTNLVTGLNTITATATDAAGNVTATSTTIAAGSFAVTATAGTGGTISSPGISSVLFNGSKTYTITPATGYHIQEVFVDDVSKGRPSIVRLTRVKADRTINVVFALNTYAIKTTAGIGGAITSDPEKVEHGGNKTYQIVPKPGYHIVNVMVNGKPQGPISSYTFQNVTGNGQRISATFTPYWTITVRKVGKGTVTNGVSVKVKEGSSKVFIIRPSAGYQIADITVDGVSVKDNLTVDNRLTVGNVTSDHDLNVTFTPII